MCKGKGVRGSVSLFLALTVSIFLMLAVVLIEGARENTLLLQAEVALDSGVNSAMGEYHKNLWEDYGLLFIDCSYKSSLPSYEYLSQHIMAAVDRNLGQSSGWLALTMQDCSVSQVVLATDDDGAAFYQQAVEAAKAETGIAILEQLLPYLTQTEELMVTGESILGTGASLNGAIEEANGQVIEVQPEVWGYNEEGEYVLERDAEYETVDIASPVRSILETSEEFILSQVLSGSSVSSLSIDVSETVSNRNRAEGLGSAEWDDGLTDKVLFLYYVYTYMGNYRDPAGEESLQYSMEYIMAGKNSDRKNLASAVSRIFLLRLADNFAVIQQNAERVAEAEAAAAAATILVPYLEPVVKQAFLLSWSYEDSLEDVRSLLSGEKVALLKSLGLSDVKLDYEQYLMILLLLTGKDRLSVRTMDVIELAVKQTEGNENFRFDGCIASCLIQGSFADDSGRSYQTDVSLSYY
ncbi:MAG: DUF5702 domain-containing protein [Lachnospiraceae bacterium]|nr:DUF5702 domain-containing protein [Lachnospiraceae bacterium]